MSQPQEFIVYCDEAGNTGPKYLDPAQPVFTLSGVVVPASKQADVIQLVDAVRKRFERPKQVMPAELKSTTLISSSKGRQNLLRFLQDLLSLGVVPVFVVADKRFCAAAKLVETFLDPEHNPGADWLETGDNVLRPKVAARFAEYPLACLEGFAEWYRKPTAEGVLPVLDALIAEAERRSDRLLAASLRQQRTDPSRVLIAETYTDEAPGGRAAGISINLPAFQLVLRLADELLASGGHRARVVHDETKFEPALKHWYTTLSNASPDEVRGVLHDGSSYRFGFRALSDFGMSKYELDRALAAADYVAGILFALGKMALGSEAGGCRHLEEARALLRHVFNDRNAMCLAEPDFIRRLMGL